MHKNTGENATPDGLFTDGDPAAGVPRSVLNSDTLNTILLELVHAVEAAGLTLDPDNDYQLAQAVAALSRVAGSTPSAIINGGMRIAQRPAGTIDDTAPKFGQVDRLMAQIADATAGGTPDFVQAIAPWADSGYCARVTGLDASTTANRIDFVYRIESQDAARFVDQPAVVGATLQQSSGLLVPATITVEAAAETQPDDWSGATSVLATVPVPDIPTSLTHSISAAVPDMGACENGIQITVSLDVPVGAGSGARYDISELRFHIGAADVPYTPVSYQAELLACRRYYERWQVAAYDILAHMAAVTTTDLRGFLRYTPKRTNDVAITVTSAADLEVMPGAAAVSSIGEVGGNLSTDGAHIQAVSSGLTAGDSYLLRAQSGAIATIEIDAELHPISVAAAPSAPAAPASITVPTGTDDDGAYTVSWDSVAGATNYQLIQRIDGGAWKQVYDGAGTSKSFSGQSDGSYEYAVRAVSPYGYSAYTYSSTVTVDSTPDAPASISSPSGTDSDGAYTVSWSSSARATQYQLQQQVNGGAWQQVYDGAGTSDTFSGQASGTYRYRVRACNASGCSTWTTGDAFTVDLPPAAPTLSADSAFKTVNFEWSLVPGASEYRLEISEDGGPWTQVYVGSNNVYSVSRQTSGIQISGRVRACDAAGCSTYSNTATGYTQ